MKKTKKALASLAIAGMTLSMIPFNAFAAGTVPTRLAGITAEQTAVAIADQTGYTGTAILASSASYGASDALTAGPLAAFLKAPILLQGPGSVLNADTKAELEKLKVTKVYVTSGTAVISQAVIDQLKGMKIEVESLGGNDRFETSVNIAKKLVALGAPVKKVAVAYGWLNQDALSIASIASAANEPIILTEKAGLSAGAKAFLAANLGITASDVIGGTGVIDASVLAQLPSPTRHFGNTAYDTNNQVIQDFASALEFKNIFVANGVTGIDALAGAPLAAMTKSAIVLTDGVNVPAAAAFTYSKSAADSVVTALGGVAVVPESVRGGVSTGKVTVVAGELAIVSVNALDDTNRYVEIDFSKAVSGLQPSDITIENADTQERYGIKTVTMSSNGQVATVELYSPDADTVVLEYRQDYNVTVNANGTILKATFNRAESMKTRVQDINVADKEITVYSDKDGTKKTLSVLDSAKFDYQGAMGELVQVWYNADNELTQYKILTSSAKYDAIEVTDVDEVKLLTEDKKYGTSDEDYTDTTKAKFAFYVDGERVDVGGEIPSGYVNKKYNFAKVGFDKSGDVEFVSAYNLQDFLIVSSVDTNDVVGVDGDGTGGSFDAEDATIVKDGKVVAVSDLEKGDILFYSTTADDEDGFAEVYNKKVTGEIETAYETSVKVDGKVYDFDYKAGIAADFNFNYGTGAVYVNEDGKTDDIDADVADELQAAGPATLFFDRGGNLVYISGDTATVEGNVKTALLTDDIVGDTTFTKSKIQIEALLEGDETKVYDINLEDLDTITIDGVDYDIDTDPSTDEYVAKLIDNSSGLADTSILALFATKADADASTDETDANIVTYIDLTTTEGQLVKLHLNDSGTLKELELFTNHANATPSPVDSTVDLDQGSSIIDKTPAAILAGTDVGSVLEAGDKYAETGYGSKLLSAKTVVFDATDDNTGFDAGDMVVTTWGEYKGSDIDNATVVYNDDNEAVAIVILHTTTEDVTKSEAVITDVNRNTDGEVTDITAYVSGELKTFEVDDVNKALTEGDVAILVTEDSNPTLVKDFYAGESDIDALYSDAGYVVQNLTVDKVDVGTKEVTAGGKIYKLVTNGLALDGQDSLDITKEALSELRDKKITVVLDEPNSLFVKFFIITEDLGVADAPDVTSVTLTVPAIVQPGANIAFAAPSSNTQLYVVKVTNETSPLTPKNYTFTGSGTVTAAQLLTDLGCVSGDLLTVELRQGTTVVSTYSAVFDTVAPKVTTKMTAAGTLTANGTHKLVFSEELDAASLTAVQSDVDAAFSGAGAAVVTSTWDADNKTLTVTITGWVAAADNVTLAAIADQTVTDLAGNSATLDIQK